MTPEDFDKLPPALAIKVLAQIMPCFAGRIESLEVPKVTRAPKYDFKIWRKGGFQWSSETSLEGLTYWRDLAIKSAASGGDYAEKDQKKADQLKFWTDYRQAFPETAVSLIRGDDQVTAEAPVDKPRIWTPLPKDDGDGDPFP